MSGKAGKAKSSGGRTSHYLSGSPAQQSIPAKTKNHILRLHQLTGNQTVIRMLSAAGPGRSLDPRTRVEMESIFNCDFGNVRIHSDESAAESARSVGAKAYTIGTDIVFGKNRYSPGTLVGKQVLAHELAHVLQQRRGGSAPEFSPNAAHEREAHRVASAAITGNSSVTVAGATGIGLARAVDPEIDEAVEKALEEHPPSASEKALSPDKLIDEHVFGPRVEEETGDLRARLTRAKQALKSNPNNKELRNRIKLIQSRLAILEGRPGDPRGKGVPVPGHGRINTRAAIQLVDGNGNLIELERGRWRPPGTHEEQSTHAEVDAIIKLRKKIAIKGIRQLPPDSRIVVVGNQVVCPEVCQPALKALADDLGVPHEQVETHVRVAPKRRGKGYASGKTTERRGLLADEAGGSTKKSRLTSKTLAELGREVRAGKPSAVSGEPSAAAAKASAQAHSPDASPKTKTLSAAAQAPQGPEAPAATKKPSSAEKPALEPVKPEAGRTRSQTGHQEPTAKSPKAVTAPPGATVPEAAPRAKGPVEPESSPGSGLHTGSELESGLKQLGFIQSLIAIGDWPRIKERLDAEPTFLGKVLTETDFLVQVGNVVSGVASNLELVLSSLPKATQEAAWVKKTLGFTSKLSEIPILGRVAAVLQIVQSGRTLADPQADPVAKHDALGSLAAVVGEQVLIYTAGAAGTVAGGVFSLLVAWFFQGFKLIHEAHEAGDRDAFQRRYIKVWAATVASALVDRAVRKEPPREGLKFEELLVRAEWAGYYDALRKLSLLSRDQAESMGAELKAKYGDAERVAKALQNDLQAIAGQPVDPRTGATETIEPLLRSTKP